MSSLCAVSVDRHFIAVIANQWGDRAAVRRPYLGRYYSEAPSGRARAGLASLYELLFSSLLDSNGVEKLAVHLGRNGADKLLDEVCLFLEHAIGQRPFS